MTAKALPLSHTRVGKIARMPHAIRLEVNKRLYDGDSGTEILRWLNIQPAVVDRLKLYFKELPVSPENLSQWRMGGYKDWLRQKEQSIEATNG